MTKNQEQQFMEFMAFKKSVVESNGLLENYPSTKQHFEVFCQQLQLIIKFKNMLIESENITSQHSHLRDELARNIILFSRKITAYALLEELTDLQGLFCYSYDELMIANEETLLEISRHILRKTTEYLTDIAEYGINDELISKFETTIDKFLIIRNDKRSADLVAAEAEQNIGSLLTASELLIQSKLAPLASSNVNNPI